MAVQLGRVGLFEFVRVHRGDDRRAVEFVQAWPEQGFPVKGAAFTNSGIGLQVTAQGAGQHGVKCQAFLAEVFAQPYALLLAQRTELVVVFGTKRSLAMAYKIEGSHAVNLSQIEVWPLSHKRR